MPVPWPRSAVGHSEQPALEVHITPVQGQEFALAKAERERDDPADAAEAVEGYLDQLADLSSL